MLMITISLMLLIHSMDVEIKNWIITENKIFFLLYVDQNIRRWRYKNEKGERRYVEVGLNGTDHIGKSES